MTLPERWLTLRVRQTDQAGDQPVDRDAEVEEDSVEALLADALVDFGGRAVHEEDGWLVTHLPEAQALALADASEPGSAQEQICARLRASLWFGDDHVSIEAAWQEHGDWAELWKRGLDARRIGARFVVTPTWIEPEVKPGDRVLTLDPGMAFGNAEHGTTRGCLRVLETCVEPDSRLLDVGAGSAVLSIAAALLGAREVEAIEMDELAIPTAIENVERNGVATQVRVRQARVDAADLAALGPHDGVIANIETGFLLPLLDGLYAATRPGGWLLLSGILQTEAEIMRTAAETVGLGLTARDDDGEWCSLLFGRRPEGPVAGSGAHA